VQVGHALNLGVALQVEVLLSLQHTLWGMVQTAAGGTKQAQGRQPNSRDGAGSARWGCAP
jgi:hypothetical protein